MGQPQTGMAGELGFAGTMGKELEREDEGRWHRGKEVLEGDPFASPLRNTWGGCLRLWERRILTGSSWRGSPQPGAGAAVAVEQRGVGNGGPAWPPELSTGCGVLEIAAARGWQEARRDLCPCPQRGVPADGKGQVSLPERHSRVKLVDRDSSGTSLGSRSASSYGDSRLPLTQLLALGILFFCPRS